MDFTQAVNDLKAKAFHFNEAYTKLINLEGAAKPNPDLYEKWVKTKAAADLIKKNVSWVTSAIDSASGFINRIGLDGLGSLSAIPLIPIAAVVGAAAALVYGTNQMIGTIADIYEFMKRRDVVNDLNADRKSKGLPPLTASEVNTILNKPNQLTNIVVLGLIGLAAYYALPKILSKWGKK